MSSLGSLPFFGKATDQILNFAYCNFRPFSHSADYPHWSIFVIMRKSSTDNPSLADNLHPKTKL